MISREVVTRVEQLEALVAEWTELLRSSAFPEVTRSPTWNLAWWRTFGQHDGRKLQCIALRRREQLIALAPLLSRRVRGTRRLELLGSGEAEADETCSEFVGVLVRPGEEQAVASELAETLRRDLDPWDELVLQRLHSEDPLVSLLAAYSEDLGHAEVLVTGGAPYAALPKSWDAFLKQRSRSQRYRLKRSLRDFEAWSQGAHELVRAQTPTELSRGITILEKLHQERWTAEDHAGAFASPLFSAFHRDVIPRLQQQRSVDLCWLEVHGKPVAALYNLLGDGDGCLRFYQSGRSVDVPKNVPIGSIIHLLNIQWCIEQGFREYDFLGGLRRYKLELSTDVRPLLELRVTRHSPKGKLHARGQRALGWLRALR